MYKKSLKLICKILSDSKYKNSYVYVYGGRSHLAKIPDKIKNVLCLVFPEYFTENDWNIYCKNNSVLINVIEKCLYDNNILFSSEYLQISINGISKNRYIIKVDGKTIVTITSDNHLDANHHKCSGIYFKNNIKYCSLCHCFSELMQSMRSIDFTKKEKTKIILSALYNLYMQKKLKEMVHKNVIEAIKNTYSKNSSSFLSSKYF